MFSETLTITVSNYFITRNCEFISQNCEFISQNCEFISQNCEFISQNCEFISQNCEFISQNCKKKCQNCEIKSHNYLVLFFIQWRKRLPYIAYSINLRQMKFTSKMKLLSLFSHPHVVPNLYTFLYLQHKKNKRTKQLSVPSTSIVEKEIPWKSMVAINCLISLPSFFKICYFMFNIRKKLIQVWNNMNVINDNRIFSFEIPLMLTVIKPLQRQMSEDLFI